MFSVRDKVMIDEEEICEVLEKNNLSCRSRVREILAKARELKGLAPEDVGVLTLIDDPELIYELFDAARFVKESIYGRRLVIFAPLYVSNLCTNECLYCAFRASNKQIKRSVLNMSEIEMETKILIEQGHKRTLLVAGEAYPSEGFRYILNAIETIYGIKSGKGEIRRVNVNIAPLTLEEFKELKRAHIGTYQLFQETYNREVYRMVHTGGRKVDYEWRISAIDRAIDAGIDDVGIGVLFGLADWRFEILALMQHVNHLEERFGIGPHTISVPRLEPASGSAIASNPPNPVSDLDFRKIVAILRLTVPYTGIIMSTRETPDTRRETFALGVSQISAGSRTDPGGYSHESAVNSQIEASQFSLGDHRSLDEVIRDVLELGYVPSFCTGCYRLGRTGQDFMDLARPGDIRHHCDPNAASTLMEYLIDYASDDTRESGEKVITEFASRMDDETRRKTLTMLSKIKGGSRDVYC
jgi:2-iminoacetate synthase